MRAKRKKGRVGGQKNEGRKERLKAFIDEKEAKRRRKLPLKTDHERLMDKSYAKKRQRGSPNSYIEQIPASTSGTATDKNKEVPASTSGPPQTRTRRYLRRRRGLPQTSSKYLHPRPIELTCLRASTQKCKKLLTTCLKKNWLGH
jgi:hypothetical protein